MSELESYGEFRFSHEVRAHPLAEVMREVNRLQVVIAQQVAPPDDGDVEAHLAYWSVVLGISRTEVNQYMEIGYMLGRMPQLAEVCQERGHLSVKHLAMLGKHTRPVADDKVDAVESRLVDVVKPRRDGEALRGVRAMATRVQRVLGECSPEARPRDVDVAGMQADRALAQNVEATVDAAIDAAAYQVETGREAAADPADSPEVKDVQAAALDYFGDRMTAREFVAVDEYGDAGTTTLTVVLERHHAVEALAIIDAVAAKMKVSRAVAFMHALRGTCDVEVNLELFRVLTPGVGGEPENTPVWLAGAGWLSPLVAESWLKRVSALRVLGDSEVEGYRPSESQRAFVRARDGVCSFPGCDVPAERCDIDHIVEFDHDLSDGERQKEGATHTANLHCLCRRHHNLKTAGIWRVVRGDDGVEAWTFLSCDEGPFARSEKTHTRHGRYTFISQTEKKTAALAEHNEKRRKLHDSLRGLVDKVRRDMRREQEKAEKGEGNGEGGNAGGSSGDSGGDGGRCEV